MATMAVLGRLGPAGGTQDHVCRFVAAAARLLRAYTTQFEAYRRLRHGGDQYVRVEHVHINEGGQAVIGNVRTSERGRAEAPEKQKHHDRGETQTRSPRRERSSFVVGNECSDPHNRKGKLSDAN
jgi:hypothetical protein